MPEDQIFNQAFGLNLWIRKVGESVTTNRKVGVCGKLGHMSSIIFVGLNRAQCLQCPGKPARYWDMTPEQYSQWENSTKKPVMPLEGYLQDNAEHVLDMIEDEAGPLTLNYDDDYMNEDEDE